MTRTRFKSTRRWAWKGATAGVLAIGLGVALVGCGGGGETTPEPSADGAGDWDSVVAAAEEEGALTVYTSQAGTDEVFKEGFEAVYPGITVTVLRQPTADLISQLDQEISAGVQSADIVYHAQTPWFPQRGEEGALAPVTVSEVADPAYADFDGATSVPMARYPFQFAYNTDLVSEAPTTIEEVVEQAEETGAAIGILDPRSSIAISSQLDAYEKAYPGIFEEIAALPHAIFGSTTPMGQSLAAGEIGIAVGMVPGVIPPLIDQGAPVAESMQSDDNVWGTDYSMAALANAPHPNAAQVFLNWAMTEDLQGWFVDEVPPYTTYLLPQGDMAFDDVRIYDPEDWEPEEWNEFLAWWDDTMQQ